MLRAPGAIFETGRSLLTLLLVHTPDGTVTTCKSVIWWLEVVLTTLLFCCADALCSKKTNPPSWNSYSCVSPLHWDLWWDQGLSWSMQNHIKKPGEQRLCLRTLSRALQSRPELERDEEALRWQNSSQAHRAVFHMGCFHLYFQAKIFRCLSNWSA